MSGPRKKAPKTIAVIDPDRCFGAFACSICQAACPVAGGKDKSEAQSFVQYLLTPEMQKVLAAGAGLGPVNRKVELPAAEQAGIPYGPAQMDKLIKIDWDTVNEHREEWNKRWTREIEG